MAYRFERVRTAMTPDQLVDLFPVLERCQYESDSQYIAMQCYDLAVGPPLPRGIVAPWYDDFNLSQLYLPFNEFQPVKVRSIYTNFTAGTGESWVLQYDGTNGHRHQEATFQRRQTYGPNHILALSVFKRVRIAGRTPRPFAHPPTVHRTSQVSEGRSETLQTLSQLSNQRGMRPALAAEVSQLTVVNQPVALNDAGEFITCRGGNRIGTLTRIVSDPNTCGIAYTVTLTNNLIVTLCISYQEAAMHCNAAI